MRIVYLLVVGLFSGGVAADLRIESDVVYGHKDGMALTYDVLIPKNANGAGVLQMISGGWYSIWQEPSRRAVAMAPLLSAGYTVFAVHHGSAPRYRVPDAVADVRAAVRHVRANAEAYAIDADRLGVMGRSAGGHLSLMLGLNAEASYEIPEKGRWMIRYTEDPGTDARLAAIVAYYPPVDLTYIVGPSDRFPALDFPKESAGAVSPIRFVSEDDPPTLLIHGDEDDLVNIRNSYSLDAELEKNGVVHDLVVLEGAGHGFRGEHAITASNAMVAWFDKHLGAAD